MTNRNLLLQQSERVTRLDSELSYERADSLQSKNEHFGDILDHYFRPWGINTEAGKFVFLITSLQAPSSLTDDLDIFLFVTEWTANQKEKPQLQINCHYCVADQNPEQQDLIVRWQSMEPTSLGGHLCKQIVAYDLDRNQCATHRGCQ